MKTIKIHDEIRNTEYEVGRSNLFTLLHTCDFCIDVINIIKAWLPMILSISLIGGETSTVYYKIKITIEDNETYTIDNGLFTILLSSKFAELLVAYEIKESSIA